MPLDLPPNPVLLSNPDTFWYTDGSKKLIEGNELIDAGVSNKSEWVELRIDADGRAATNTITGPKLVAILVALQEMKDTQSHEAIATDSQASMFMIYIHLYEPHKHAENKHKAILRKIVAMLLQLAQQGSEATFLKVKSHIGKAGNETADELAGCATDST